jgi:hypothetical protein
MLVSPPLANIGRSDMGKGLDVVRNFTCNAGNLIPVEYLLTNPGDILRPRIELICRALPLNAPVMTPYYAKTYFFHCPIEQIWNGFESDFITGGEDGSDATVHPYATSPASTGYAVGSLADYLGIPTGVASKNHSALKFRAYAEIYNWHFRNHNVQTTKLTVDKTSGQDTTTYGVTASDIAPMNCNWGYDYFTASLPWTQRGTAVDMTVDIDRVDSATAWRAYESGSNTLVSNKSMGMATTTGELDDRVSSAVSLDPQNQIEGTVDIATLRETFAKQNIFEILAKVGGFYSQWLRGILGVQTDDNRLEIPEYLGSSTTEILFTEVLTTADSGSYDVGDMLGHGITGDNVSTIQDLHVKRHGILMALFTIKPVSTYSQGIEKMDTYTTRFDYHHPQLEGLSLQPIYDKEIYWGSASDTSVFGYQDNYYEYRQRRNSIHGKLRNGENLDHWVSDRYFASEPSLNTDFVTCTPSTDIFQAPAEDQFIVQAKIVYDKALRKVKTNPKPATLR